MEQLMKFIHVSDVHLGIKPDEGKPWSEKRAQDIWDSFAEVIGAAVELKPDFLLISGDLFHAQPLKKRTSGSQLSFQQNTPDENYPDGGQSRLSSYKIVLSDDGVGGECLFFPSGGAGTF